MTAESRTYAKCPFCDLELDVDGCPECGARPDQVFSGLNRDGGPRIDPTVLALLSLSDIVNRFDDSLAFAKTSGECVQIAARIGVGVKALLKAQDRALEKADSF